MALDFGKAWVIAKPVLHTGKVGIAVHALDMESIFTDVVPSAVCTTNTIKARLFEQVKDIVVEVAVLAVGESKVADPIANGLLKFLRGDDDLIKDPFWLGYLSKVRMGSRVPANFHTGIGQRLESFDGIDRKRLTPVGVVRKLLLICRVFSRDEIGKRDLFCQQKWDRLLGVFGIPVVKSDGQRRLVIACTHSVLAFFQGYEFEPIPHPHQLRAKIGKGNRPAIL